MSKSMQWKIQNILLHAFRPFHKRSINFNRSLLSANMFYLLIFSVIYLNIDKVGTLVFFFLCSCTSCSLSPNRNANVCRHCRRLLLLSHSRAILTYYCILTWQRRKRSGNSTKRKSPPAASWVAFLFDTKLICQRYGDKGRLRARDAFNRITRHRLRIAFSRQIFRCIMHLNLFKSCHNKKGAKSAGREKANELTMCAANKI